MDEERRFIADHLGGHLLEMSLLLLESECDEVIFRKIEMLVKPRARHGPEHSGVVRFTVFMNNVETDLDTTVAYPKVGPFLMIFYLPLQSLVVFLRRIGVLLAPHSLKMLLGARH